MKAILKLTALEIKLFFRDKGAVFWTFIFPIIILWLIGSIFGNGKTQGYSYAEAYVPSWIGIMLLNLSFFTIGTTISTHREKGILRRYQTTPLGPSSILTSYLLTGVTLFFFTSILIVVTGMLLYHLQLPKYPVSFMIAVILSIVAIFPFGLFATSLARNARQSVAISSAVLNIALLLSGATIPLSLMPSWLLMVAKVIPLYYVVDLYRYTWAMEPLTNKWMDVIILLVMFVCFTVLAIKSFRWDAKSS